MHPLSQCLKRDFLEEREEEIQFENKKSEKLTLLNSIPKVNLVRMKLFEILGKIPIFFFMNIHFNLETFFLFTFQI